MAKQIINIGTVANDGTGDPLRTAFTKVNENFTEVYNTSNAAFAKANTTIYTHIELTAAHNSTGNIITFTRAANTNISDVIDTGLSLARANNGQGLYNSALEASYNASVSPANTEWNWSGWNNLDNVHERHYRTWREALRNKVGSNIVGAELVMRHIPTDKYYKVKFTNWDIGGVGGANGAFSYTRELINTSNKVGINFEDGSTQYTASNPLDWPVVWMDNNNYTIRSIDANRILRGYDMTLSVPRDSDLDFPIGSEIGIITENVGITVERVQHIEEVEAQIYGVGYGEARASWFIPARSFARLIKIGENNWYLVVANYLSDISNLTDTTNVISSISTVANSANVLAQAAFDAANAAGDSITGNIFVSATSSEINFVANSSGDGFGYSTIELRPDTNATQDQYIIIDPTAPSHIHIRAGGQQDASGAQLFLGGEQNYFSVSDGSGVRLQGQQLIDNYYYYSDPAQFTSGSWIEDGGFYFVEFTTANSQMQGHAFDLTNDTDNNELIVYHSGGSSNTLTSSGSASNLGGGVYRVGVNEAPPTNPLSLTNIEFHLFTARTSSLDLTGNDLTIQVQDDVRITGGGTVSLRNESVTEPISIITNYDGDTKTWEFDVYGTLRFPQNGILRIDDTAPLTSIGSTDDKQGTLVFSNTHIYFCSADYDGTTNVWKRLAWSGDTW